MANYNVVGVNPYQIIGCGGTNADIATTGQITHTGGFGGEHIPELLESTRIIIDPTTTIESLLRSILQIPEVAAGAFLLTCDAGDVPITGTNALLNMARVLQAQVGALPIAGVNAVLKRGFVLVGNTGNIPITGITAALKLARILQAQSGTVAITGTNIMLNYNRVLQGQSGSVPINGVVADLILSGTPGPGPAENFYVVGLRRRRR